VSVSMSVCRCIDLANTPAVPSRRRGMHRASHASMSRIRSVVKARSRTRAHRRCRCYRCRVCAECRELARQAIDHCLLLLLELEMHLSWCHGPRMPHGHARRVHARYMAAHARAQRRERMPTLCRRRNCAPRRGERQRRRGHGIYLRRSA
jgi:hypothetical protein